MGDLNTKWNELWSKVAEAMTDDAYKPDPDDVLDEMAAELLAEARDRGISDSRAYQIIENALRENRVAEHWSNQRTDQPGLTC